MRTLVSRHENLFIHCRVNLTPVHCHVQQALDISITPFLVITIEPRSSWSDGHFLRGTASLMCLTPKYPIPMPSRPNWFSLCNTLHKFWTPLWAIEPFLDKFNRFRAQFLSDSAQQKCLTPSSVISFCDKFNWSNELCEKNCTCVSFKLFWERFNWRNLHSRSDKVSNNFWMALSAIGAMFARFKYFSVHLSLISAFHNVSTPFP